MMLGLSLSSKLDRGSYIVSISKTTSKKNGALICLMKVFLLLRLLFISINLPDCLARNTVVMFCWVLPVAAWTCWIMDRNGYVGLLVLHLLTLLISLLIAET